MDDRIFLMDSNSLITPYNTFYSPSLSNNFWKRIKNGYESGNIAMLDIVQKEIMNGTGDLQKWLKEIKFDKYVKCMDKEVYEKYGEIINFLKNNECYTQVAINSWTNDKTADPWIIAAAAAKGYDIVTFEKYVKNINPVHPSRNPKIPNIAAEFNVRVIDLYQMMKILGIRLD